jgi:hypothetical protein
MVVSPPYPPVALRVSIALTYGPNMPLVSRVAIPQVTRPTPISIRIPPDYANFSSFLARFVYLEFETDHPMITISSFFVYGTAEPFRAFFPESYQDLDDYRPANFELRGGDTTPLDVVIRSVREVNYETVLKVEVSRLFHRLGRLECAVQLKTFGFDPLEFNVKKHRCVCPAVGSPQGHPEPCAKCQQSSAWKCDRCLKSFCAECSEQNRVESHAYFTGLPVLCDECETLYRQILASVDSLVRLYHSFHLLCAPQEHRTNEWLLANLVANTPVVTNFTQFPSAFFTNASDPAANLILTAAGGVATGTQNWMLALGADMSLTQVEVVGSKECVLHIGLVGSAIHVELKGSQSRECRITGQFFTVSLRAGTLNKLILTGVEAIQPAKTLVVESKTVSLGKQLSSKVLSFTGKRQVILDIGKRKDVKGLAFRDMVGLTSVVLGFFASKWDDAGEKPSASDFYYIPEGESQFVLRFKATVNARFVQIVFYDILPSFVEPKLTILGA